MDKNQVSSEHLKKEIYTLKKRLKSYEIASDGASEGLWDRDLITDEVFVSPPWLKMLGYLPEEIDDAANIWRNWMHEEDRARALQNFDDFISEKIDQYDIDFRMRHKDGHYIWVRSKAALTKDENGVPIRISGSHTNITSKKNAGSQLSTSEKKYKFLFENALIGIMRVKASNLFVKEINKRGLDILAMSELDRHLKFIDLLANKEQVDEIFDLLKNNDGLEEHELKIKRWNESETWVSLSAVLYEDEDGSYYDVIFRDITEFKDNLAELQKLNFELDNFVYHASHDIRSPLRSIMGLVEILKSERNQAQIKKTIEMISGSINRLDKFVVDLLAMSRDKRVDEEAVHVSMMVEINNSVTNFHHVYNTKGLEVRTKIKQTVPFKSDLAKIRIILNNIISNAIKYRRVEDALLSFINIYVDITEQELSLIIEDNGEGIPEDKVDKIFDMFFRASESSEGSGLGMYIVSNVIKKLGATFDVSSKEGQGTTFNIKIPNSYNAID